MVLLVVVGIYVTFPSFYVLPLKFCQRRDYERDMQDNDCILHPLPYLQWFNRSRQLTRASPHMTARHKIHCPYHYCHFTAKCPALDSLSLHWVWFPSGEAERGTRGKRERSEGVHTDKIRGLLCHCLKSHIIITCCKNEGKQPT